MFFFSLFFFGCNMIVRVKILRFLKKLVYMFLVCLYYRVSYKIKIQKSYPRNYNDRGQRHILIHNNIKYRYLS